MDKKSKRCRLGIDVGGTFTDFVLSDLDTGMLIYFKEPSTPEDPSQAVETGLSEVIRRAMHITSNIELVVHGTTIALNTIIQRKGVSTALVVSRGNRDVFEIARARLPSSFNYRVGKEVPLIPRDLIFEVSARTGADGRIIENFVESELDDIVGQIQRRHVAAVAVMLLNSYINGILEQQVARALRDRLPGVHVISSAEIWPEKREYERALVTALNAYVHPMMDRYLEGLEQRFDRAGCRGSLYITASNGGSLSVKTARLRPIETVLSGPACGVVAATHLSRLVNCQMVISFDMGGTSSDIAISTASELEYTTNAQIGDFPLVLPVVNVSSIGAGGGSIVWVDSQGLLKVGPQSAGAVPGPACYGIGGSEPTVTDCYVATGCIEPTQFLGGRIPLDKAASLRALDDVAAKIGMVGSDRAIGIAEAALRVATAKMATELYKLMAQRGLDPRDFVLLSFGGAGPTHANLLAEEARLKRIIVPPAPGTFCAMGALLTDVKRDFIRSMRRRLTSELELSKELLDIFSDLEKEGIEWINGEGDIVGETDLSWSAEMRYKDQAYDLNIPIPVEVREHMAGEALCELFHQAHERLYGFRDNESPIELMAMRTRVVGRMPTVELPTVKGGEEMPQPAGSRRVYTKQTWQNALVYERRVLHAGHRIVGPAIVEQDDTTCLILAGWIAETDTFGNLNIQRNKTLV